MGYRIYAEGQPAAGQLSVEDYNLLSVENENVADTVACCEACGLRWHAGLKETCVL